MHGGKFSSPVSYPAGLWTHHHGVKVWVREGVYHFKFKIPQQHRPYGLHLHGKSSNDYDIQKKNAFDLMVAPGGTQNWCRGSHGGRPQSRYRRRAPPCPPRAAEGSAAARRRPDWGTPAAGGAQRPATLPLYAPAKVWTTDICTSAACLMMCKAKRTLGMRKVFPVLVRTVKSRCTWRSSSTSGGKRRTASVMLRCSTCGRRDRDLKMVVRSLIDRLVIVPP